MRYNKHLMASGITQPVLNNSGHWPQDHHRQHDYLLPKASYTNGTNFVHVVGLLMENIGISEGLTVLDHQSSSMFQRLLT